MAVTLGALFRLESGYLAQSEYVWASTVVFIESSFCGHALLTCKRREDLVQRVFWRGDVQCTRESGSPEGCQSCVHARYVTTWAWTYKERGAAQCLWCLSLLQCQGSSICSCLSSASLSPFTKASRAVFPFLSSCSWSHTVILMAFLLCYYCYVREVIATAVRVEPLSPAFSCTGFLSF